MTENPVILTDTSYFLTFKIKLFLSCSCYATNMCMSCLTQFVDPVLYLFDSLERCKIFADSVFQLINALFFKLFSFRKSDINCYIN